MDNKLCLLSMGDNIAKIGFSKTGGLFGRISLQRISAAKELNFNAGHFSHYQNRMKFNNTGTGWRACLRSPAHIAPLRGVLLGWSDRDLLQRHSHQSSITLILHLLSWVPAKKILVCNEAQMKTQGLSESLPGAPFRF